MTTIATDGSWRQSAVEVRAAAAAPSEAAAERVGCANQNVAKSAECDPSAEPSKILEELRTLITQARTATARTPNPGLAVLHWRIAHLTRRELLPGQRAEYGEGVVTTLARRLTQEFGRGWIKAALTRMVKFAERFSDPEIVATLSQPLGWNHLVEWLPLKGPLPRDFYAEVPAGGGRHGPGHRPAGPVRLVWGRAPAGSR